MSRPLRRTPSSGYQSQEDTYSELLAVENRREWEERWKFLESQVVPFIQPACGLLRLTASDILHWGSTSEGTGNT